MQGMDRLTVARLSNISGFSVMNTAEDAVAVVDHVLILPSALMSVAFD